MVNVGEYTIHGSYGIVFPLFPGSRMMVLNNYVVIPFQMFRGPFEIS